jgi:putative adhesin
MRLSLPGLGPAAAAFGKGGRLVLALAAVTTIALAGCVSMPSEEGKFERVLTVTGPVSLELAAGSEDLKLTTGSSSQVRISAEFSVKAWSSAEADKRVHELSENPPIEQHGNVIRVGRRSSSGGGGDFKYEIEVPPETELRGTSGSGDVEARGIRGPVNVTAGSGDVALSDINEQIQVLTASGDISLSNIAGAVHLTSGSGDMALEKVHGDIRARTGSGDLAISDPGGAVTVDTSGGDVTFAHASDDLRIHTSSGNITVDGNPGSSNFWELHTNSGDVVLRLSANPSFRLEARSSSGDIEASVPLTLDGSASKHEMRARLGDGKARVEIQTSSGSITLQ